MSPMHFLQNSRQWWALKLEAQHLHQVLNHEPRILETRNSHNSLTRKSSECGAKPTGARNSSLWTRVVGMVARGMVAEAQAGKFCSKSRRPRGKVRSSGRFCCTTHHCDCCELVITDQCAHAAASRWCDDDEESRTRLPVPVEYSVPVGSVKGLWQCEIHCE